MIEIKHKVTGKVLLKVKAKTLVRADLSGVDLSGADLSGADLSWADLSEADLTWADLSGADLRGAKGEFIFNFGVKLKIAGEKKRLRGKSSERRKN